MTDPYADDWAEPRPHLFGTWKQLSGLVVGTGLVWAGVFWFIRGVLILAQAVRG